MNTPTFIITNTSNNFNKIVKPQVRVDFTFPGADAIFRMFELTVTRDSRIYFEYEESTTESVYSNLVKNPSPMNYLKYANHVIFVSDCKFCKVLKGRYGNQAEVVNEQTIKLINDSEGKDLYFTAEVFNKHKMTLLAMGYTIKCIELIGEGCYKHNAYVAFKVNDPVVES